MDWYNYILSVRVTCFVLFFVVVVLFVVVVVLFCFCFLQTVVTHPSGKL